MATMTTIAVTVEVAEALRVRAKRAGVSVGEMVRRVVEATAGLREVVETSRGVAEVPVAALGVEAVAESRADLNRAMVAELEQPITRQPDVILATAAVQAARARGDLSYTKKGPPVRGAKLPRTLDTPEAVRARLAETADPFTE
jgi:hypothetical protein